MEKPIANFDEAEKAILADGNVEGWYEFTVYIPTGNGRNYVTQTAKYYKTSDGKLENFKNVTAPGYYKYLGEDGNKIDNPEILIPIGERSYFRNILNNANTINPKQEPKKSNRKRFFIFGGSKKSKKTKQRKCSSTQKKITLNKNSK